MLAAIFVMSFACYRGYSMVLAAPLASILILLTSGLPVTEGLFVTFAGSAGGTFQNLLFTFIAVSVFSQVMIETKATDDLAEWIALHIPAEYAPASVCVLSALLTLGGMVAIGVYQVAAPVAISLCRKANYSRDIGLAGMICGAWSFVLCAPYTPSSHNTVCIELMGTDMGAGAVPGLAACAMMGILDICYLVWQARRWRKKGRTFGNNAGDTGWRGEMTEGEGCGRRAVRAVLPILLVLMLYNLCAFPIQAALFAGAAAGALLHVRRLPPRRWLRLTESGFLKGVGNIATVSLAGGLGGVLMETPAFQYLLEHLGSMEIQPYLLAFGAGAVMSVCTGSAINALNTVIPYLMPLFASYGASGISMGYLHRMLCMGALSLGTMPYNGSLQVCISDYHTSVREAYFPIWVTCMAIPVLASLCVGLPLAVWLG